MNIEDTIRNTLNSQISDGTFRIERIDYDEKNFGNICVLLSSNRQINLRFIKDKGVYWCEVGQDGEWFYLEDVLTLIGESFSNSSEEFMEFIADIITLIKKNMSQISQPFDENNFLETKIKIKEIATNRAMQMFMQ